VRIIDFVGTSHPAPLRRWASRQRGYKAMGCRSPAATASDNLDFDLALGETAAGKHRSEYESGYEMQTNAKPSSTGAARPPRLPFQCLT
jgi:hypothetical protein